MRKLYARRLGREAMFHSNRDLSFFCGCVSIYNMGPSLHTSDQGTVKNQGDRRQFHLPEKAINDVENCDNLFQRLSQDKECVGRTLVTGLGSLDYFLFTNRWIKKAGW